MVANISGFTILKWGLSDWRHIYNTVKPVFRGHLNIPEKVSPHDRCPIHLGFILSIVKIGPCSEKIGPDHRVSSHPSAPPKWAKVYPASRRRSSKRVGLKGQLAPHCVP